MFDTINNTQNEPQNLKDLLKNNFNVDLPISGGIGNSKDNAVIIHRTEFNNYISVEYGVLYCLQASRKVEIKVIEQTLITHEKRTLDKMHIETKSTNGDIWVENYYFDITECFIR